MESFNDARDNIDGLLGHFNELYESFGEVWVEPDDPKNVEGVLSAQSALWMVQRSLRKFWYRFELAYSRLVAEELTLDDACHDVMPAMEEEFGDIDNGIDMFKRVVDGESSCGTVMFDDEIKVNEAYDKVVGIPRRAHRIYDNVKQLLNGTH